MKGLFSKVSLLALLALALERKSNERRELWCLGDSIGQGIAAALRRAGVTIEDDSQQSSTTAQWAERLPNVAKANRIAVVSLGTNDAQDRGLRREWSTNVREIVRELVARGCRVLWVLPPSSQSLVPSQSDLETLAQLGAEFLWLRVPMVDAWHPSAAGYDTLAAEILRRAHR